MSKYLTGPFADIGAPDEYLLQPTNLTDEQASTLEAALNGEHANEILERIAYLNTEG